MFWILVGVVVIALFYYYLVKPLSYWKDMGVKQGKPVIIFGDTWGTVFKIQSFPDMIQYMYNMVPNVRYTGTYQFFAPNLLLKDPELIKQITVKDFDHFVDHRGFVDEHIEPLMGKNLFALKGQRWRDMRATLSPTFTSSKMKAMFTLMLESADNFVKHFKNQNEDIITLDMKDAFARYTNDVIATSAFGINCNSLEDKDNQFYMMGKNVTNFSGFWRNLKFTALIFMPSLFKLFKIKLFEAYISNFFNKLVKDTVRYREENNIVRPDMIHLLMEARKGNLKYEEANNALDAGFATVQESEIGKSKLARLQITDEDITSHAMIFFFAGFDAASTLLCFGAHELAVNPDVQEKLRAEINNTHHDCNGKLTYEALIKMKYMDMVVTEILRKWPIAIQADRVCTKPYTIEPIYPDEKPVHLKVGDILCIPTFGIHRDPKYYPDPEKFDPERFSDENKNNIKPYTYLPFGVGPRNCIGSRFALLETKVALFQILNNFEIVPVKETSIPLKISKKQINITAEGGFWLGLKRIKEQ